MTYGYLYRLSLLGIVGLPTVFLTLGIEHPILFHWYLAVLRVAWHILN